ncbi:hypothetical protein GCM10010495_69600 [Kitasatospora herbaricolor]|uniref:Wadjet anti-phage system protein JetD domain-containing protein n=1 Tax=Kitasatospora herbaricolor TaxID=68217 RepID=UPI00174B82B7|nr:Wadjet anti-phage system protein JetD domain-containing protein [Kitasatospora herbaricolor]MDQ0313325.1 hypothetical protein [Kitasatospora herbaricolor]GGV42028.1 hypothetical protein GCM10010495_69600 [Kitasatospora herbaricolor]
MGDEVRPQPGLLFGEGHGRVPVTVEGVPAGLQAFTVPVRREGEYWLPRDRKRRLRLTEVDLLPAGKPALFAPPQELTDADLLWVLGAQRREWDSTVRRFGSRAQEVAHALVRCGAVVLRCEVDVMVTLGPPVRWRLTHAWADQAEERCAQLRGPREPRRARSELLELMSAVTELKRERELLAAIDENAGLVVPQGSTAGTAAWSVYEAAVKASAAWWGLRDQGEKEVTLKQLAALALGGSKRWTGQQQVAFANLVGVDFEEAVTEEDTDLRIKGPLSWRIGEVAVDAAVARPWVGVPAQGLRIVGEATCTALGVLVIENADTFGQVCRRLPDLTSRWLCVWGRGYARDQLVAMLAWLQPLPVAAWCDLDADGIAIVHDLSRRLGTPVHAVGMDAQTWRTGPYRERLKNPRKEKARDAKLAADLAHKVDGDLRELALAIAGSGESLEQETLYTTVLPRLPDLLAPLLKEKPGAIPGDATAVCYEPEQER